MGVAPYFFLFSSIQLFGLLLVALLIMGTDSLKVLLILPLHSIERRKDLQAWVTSLRNLNIR